MPESNSQYHLEGELLLLLTDLSLAARSAVLSGDFQKTVGINLEGGNKLSLATGHGRNAIKFKFTE